MLTNYTFTTDLNIVDFHLEVTYFLVVEVASSLCLCELVQTNLKQDIEIQKITSSAMIENVAAYLRKGVSSCYISFILFDDGGKLMFSASCKFVIHQHSEHVVGHGSTERVSGSLSI